MNNFEGVIPILSVKGLAASMDYYVNKLGFEKKWDSEAFGLCGPWEGRDLSLRGRAGSAWHVDVDLSEGR